MTSSFFFFEYERSGRTIGFEALYGRSLSGFGFGPGFFSSFFSVKTKEGVLGSVPLEGGIVRNEWLEIASIERESR